MCVRANCNVEYMMCVLGERCCASDCGSKIYEKGGMNNISYDMGGGQYKCVLSLWVGEGESKKVCGLRAMHIWGIRYQGDN